MLVNSKEGGSFCQGLKIIDMYKGTKTMDFCSLAEWHYYYASDNRFEFTVCKSFMLNIHWANIEWKIQVT